MSETSGRPKVLFVATVVKTHIMEFHIPYLKMLKEMGCETAVAARNDYQDPKECVIPYCDEYIDIPFERNPLKPGNFRAYKMLKKLINEGGYDIIHCHTPVGGLLARMASRKVRKRGTKVFYTAHGLHFFKGAPLKNWLIYYPVEKHYAKKTDVLITINQEDYQRASKFKARKTVYVPGVGIDTSRFGRNESVRVPKREELHIAEDEFVILSVGELIKRKNYEVVLEALSQLKKDGRISGIRYLISGDGVLLDNLRSETEKLGLSDHVVFLGYRRDVEELCNCSDLFVFMSHQEGLPVALMEAMACGLPVICSNTRGNTDLIKNGENGEIVESSPEAVAQAILKLRDQRDLCKRYAEAAELKIKAFDIASVSEKMRELYSEALAHKGAVVK